MQRQLLCLQDLDVGRLGFTVNLFFLALLSTPPPKESHFALYNRDCKWERGSAAVEERIVNLMPANRLSSLSRFPFLAHLSFARAVLPFPGVPCHSHTIVTRSPTGQKFLRST
jgi:hypothetical protein